MTIKTAAEMRKRPMNEVKAARAEVWEAMKEIVAKAAFENRDLHASESREHQAFEEELEAFSGLIDRDEQFMLEQRKTLVHTGNAPEFARGHVLTGEQRMADYVRSRGLVRDEDEGLSLQKWLRGTITGDWAGADAERRTMLEGTLSAGGFMLPTPLSAQIIDRARNQAAVFRAGAQTVPMDSATLKMARVAGDPTAAWHTEDSTITPSDSTLELVTFTAHTLAGIVKLSMELVEDASNMDSMIGDIFGKVFALKLDQAALYGTGVAPEPLGVKGSTGVTTLTSGANGSTPASYDFLIDAVGTLADNNFTASGIIDAARTERTLAKLKDSTLQPLRVPEYVASVPRYSTNQVPVNVTVGTSTDTSDVFTADWSNLLIGVRHQFSIKLLDQRYADQGDIGLLCWWRGDVQLARPKAFVTTTGIRP